MNNTRTAIITGAGQGIGRGIALELAKANFNIAGVDVIFQPENHDKGLFEVKERVQEFGAEFLPIQADISDLSDHEKIIQQTLQTFGSIDVLVNNAGVAPKQRLDILETTPDSYDRVMSINARGPFFLTQRVARYMIQNPNASISRYIIFISSISAYYSSPSRAEYCLSKAAISHAARIFAHRLAEFGIRVFELRPGIIQTDMTAVVKEKYDKLIAEGLVPQHRWGFPEDVGRAVLGLVQGYFDYSTGLIAEVSGGMNICRL
ncbi:MAG: 3-ketoacyl-ACP reductase [candidate division KSB1 bacterium]|nr:3-ketoacyl-ACP reductase [candidate division KSB1 bacterium]MDZ7336327.1 3-ketoacyl-ACP reductase [candidate division KSB1 bacterium]MDZ7375258.1 3-ketoacyl-ACP reductase [candidate division KSB1 bacterium]MDZ7402381.1 3-ketoacyl-ACP reductase [candidate division KSB1 bacterium]